MGFPIRRFLDQRSFAAPQDLSQRTTSFIASQRQGIHQMLLRHLITLMIDVRSAAVHRPKRKTCLRPRGQRHVLLATAYPAHLAAGQGWFAELGRPLAEYAASLRFQTSAPPTPTRAGHELTRSFALSHAKNSGTDPKNGGACRDRTDDLKLAKLPLSQLS